MGIFEAIKGDADPAWRNSLGSSWRSCTFLHDCSKPSKHVCELAYFTTFLYLLLHARVAERVDSAAPAPWQTPQMWHRGSKVYGLIFGGAVTLF